MKINIHCHSQTNHGIEIVNHAIGNDKTMPNCPFSVGVHPWFVSDISFFDAEIYLKKIINNKNFYAIGEIGIDKKCMQSINSQLFFFENQLIFAEKFGLPVIIHAVKSYDLILNLRKKYNKTFWIIHDFNSSLQMAKQLINKNIFLSFGNNFMRKNSKLYTFFHKLPLEYIFFETDIHDFSIDEVYQKATYILNCKTIDLENIIISNFNKIFNNAR